MIALKFPFHIVLMQTLYSSVMNSHIVSVMVFLDRGVCDCLNSLRKTHEHMSCLGHIALKAKAAG